MKKLTLILCLFSSILNSQNLVPNPGFETFTSCPVGPDELYKAANWTSYRASPDYMNACNNFSMGVPSNWGGYQQAFGGVAYGACATYDSLTPNYREYLGATLITPLSIGVKYFVSFQTNLGIGGLIDANYATDRIGLRFSNLSSSSITNSADVYSNSIVTDSSGWTKIFGSFIADSAYTRVVLGNFFDDGNTAKIEMVSGSTDVAYYYIDDVCVSTDSLYSLLYTAQSEQSFDCSSLSVYPNPFQNVLNISLPNYSYDIIMYDILGNVVYEKNNLRGDSVLDIDFLPNGIIFLQVLSSNNFFCYKLLKL